MSPVISSVLFFWTILLVTSVTGAYLVVRLIPRPARVAHRMLMQPSLTVAGMMFSILLGFFTAQSMKDYTDAHNNIANEANTLGEVFRDAKGLPADDRIRIRKLCRQYADSVINDEWPLLAQGKTSARSQSIMNEIWEAALSVEPTNMREQSVYDSFFKAMNAFGGHRRVRTADVNYGLQAQLWAIIAIGGAGIIILTFIFAPESKRFHAGLLTCLLVPMTLNIFLLAEYSYPFAGLLVVKPTMFESLRNKIMHDPDVAPRYVSVPIAK